MPDYPLMPSTRERLRDGTETSFPLRRLRPREDRYFAWIRLLNDRTLCARRTHDIAVRAVAPILRPERPADLPYLGLGRLAVEEKRRASVRVVPFVPKCRGHD